MTHRSWKNVKESRRRTKEQAQPRAHRRGNVAYPGAKPCHAIRYDDDWWFVYRLDTSKDPRFVNFKVIADEVPGKGNFWLGLNLRTGFFTRTADEDAARRIWPSQLYEAVQQSLRNIGTEPQDRLTVRLLELGETMALPRDCVPDNAFFGTQVRNAIEAELAIF